MNSIVLVTIALALASVVAAAGPACNSLKKEKVDFQWLIRSSPFTYLRSNTPTVKCGRVVYVGPAGDSTGYIGSGIKIIGNYTMSTDFKTTDNSLFKAVLCANGQTRDFQVVYVNNKSPIATGCAVACNDKDPTKYDIVFCIGRTSKDESDIQTFLNSKLKGVEGIVNPQTGCPKPQHCHLFTN